MADQLSLAKLRPDTVREAVAPLADETPLARFRLHGEQALSDAEIVSLAANVPVEQAQTLLQGGLRWFSRRDWRFSGKDARGKKTAVRIAAALELGRRVAGQAWSEPDPIRTADDLGRGLVARYSHRPQEELGAVFLDSRNHVLREVPAIYRGTVNSCTVSTRDVLRIGLMLNAACIVVWHNHPSGHPDPSAEDILYTRKLREACTAVGIDLLDHIVIGHNRWVSLKSKGLL